MRMAVGRMHGGQKDKEGEKEEQKGRRQVPGVGASICSPGTR